MNVTTYLASLIIATPAPTPSPVHPQLLYNYIGATGPVVLQYNSSNGGAVQYKNPNQTKTTSAQMNSPSDQICMGRNQLIIVGDRRVYGIPTKRRNLQTTTTAAPMIVDGSTVTASL